MLDAVSSALGGEPGSTRPTIAKTAKPIPVAASHFLPLASATVICVLLARIAGRTLAHGSDGACGYPHRGSHGSRIGPAVAAGDAPGKQQRPYADRHRRRP